MQGGKGGRMCEGVSAWVCVCGGGLAALGVGCVCGRLEGELPPCKP